jgi:hypothetical protein
VSEDDFLVDVCAPDGFQRYLSAPNAEVKRRKDGSIRLIRLRSVGDDRGHLGEDHGRSTITTERVRNDWGRLVGSDLNLKHKETCDTWGIPAFKTSEHHVKETQAQALPGPAATSRRTLQDL